MTGPSINVFVSYSREDASLVAPVIRLLRVNTAYVFQDVDGIRPGKRWQEEIARGIAESNLVVVFWCSHASQSAAVGAEWRAALEQKKDLLPLLMDATPLPGELLEFQYIDFRGTVGENHSSLSPDTPDTSMPSASSHAPSSTRSLPPSPAKSPARWLSLGAIAAFAVGAIAIGLHYVDSQGPLVSDHPPVEAPTSEVKPAQVPPPAIEVQPVPPKQMPHPLPPPPPKPESDAKPLSLFFVLLLIGAAVLAVFGWYSWRKRRRLEVDLEASEPELRPSSRWENTGTGIEVERQMASRIEAELARRAGN
jgi:hypothetical protein